MGGGMNDGPDMPNMDSSFSEDEIPF